MTPERYRQAEELFSKALTLTQAQRTSFLETVCFADPELRVEVESLLAAHEQAGNFIDTPPSKTAAEVLAGVNAGPGQMIGHYQIINLLGKGGMGEVYLAVDTHLDRRVALKLLPGQFTSNGDRVLRFVQEAKAASALNHPNIITIHETGKESGTHFIATEFIEGQTLRHLIDSSTQSLGDVLDIVIQVASALSAAHEHGIVHRDAKPENIMIRPDGLVKVLDFGLAKLLSRREASDKDVKSPRPEIKTAPGLILGTLQYMSPEQANGKPVDARTDIFTLGVVLYELIAGRAPFNGDNALEVTDSILAAEPVPLTQARGDVPLELQRIVGKALRKDKEQRYQSCREMLADLKSLKQELELKAKLNSKAQQSEITRPIAAAKRAGVDEMNDGLSDKLKVQKLLASMILIIVTAAIIIGLIWWWRPK